MVQYDITLSDDAYQFVQDQVASGRFASMNDVVSKILEDARLNAAKEKLAEKRTTELVTKVPDPSP